MRLPLTIFLSISLSSLLLSQNWDPDQEAILKAIDKLSEATALDGSGAPAYGEVLDAEFTRWTMGSDNMETKESWLKGIEGWFDDGWRVSNRTNDMKEVNVLNDLAFVRRVVSETYVDTNGDQTDPSKAAISEVWIKRNSWKLLRVEVVVLD